MSVACRTPLTELFGIRRPILVGGMMWLSTAGFVAACARAGTLSFLTPRSYDTLDAYREGLAQAIALAEGAPVGVNLTIPRHTSGIPTGEYLRIAQDLGVRCFETAGSAPGALFAAIRAGGGRVIHKCTRVRHALSAMRDGADAIALVGMEAGGHPGTNPHPAHILAAASLPGLEVPLAIGGGIGTGEQAGGDVVVLDPGLDGRDRLVEVAARVQMQRVGDVVAREHEGLAGVQPDTDNEDAVGEVVVIGGEQVGSGVAGELLHRVVDVFVVVGEDHVVQLGDHRGNLEPFGIPEDPGLVPGAEHRVRIVDHHVRLFGRREPGRILHDVRGLLRDGHRLGDSEGRPSADQGGDDLAILQYRRCPVSKTDGAEINILAAKALCLVTAI